MPAAQAAAEILGAEVRVQLGLPNRRLFDTFEARVALASEFRKYRPRLVLGFGEKTPLASPDHWQAMQITDAAVFYSRLTKWDEHFDGLPVHLSETDWQLRRGAPLLGEHNRRIYGELLGLDDAELDSLRSEGVI